MLATIKNAFPDFPGDLVIKSPPVNAEDTQVQSLAWKDPTCCRTTKPMYHSY